MDTGLNGKQFKNLFPNYSCLIEFQGNAVSLMAGPRMDAGQLPKNGTTKFPPFVLRKTVAFASLTELTALERRSKRLTNSLSTT